ncbi:MAG TPA: hypothetical protein DEB31_02845 [Clostridiales bacterium]|nr:hypothetical protein [Clostridiales bacterium]
MNNNTINTQQSNWPVSNQYPAANVKESSESEEIQPEEKEAGLPEIDQYTETGNQSKESPGLYWLESDEEGNQKVVFTPPTTQEALRAEAAREPQITGSGTPKDDDGGDSGQPASDENEKPATYRQTATLDPSEIKAEIARVKERKAALTRELQTAGGDEDRRKDIEAQIQQVEAELAMKDNPEYIKRNAKKTFGPATRETH